MKVTVVGCSPAWPNPGGAHSGYLVESTSRVLLDCGPGVLSRLREAEAWPSLDAIAITHFHLDHWGDLVPWTWGAMFGPGRDAPKAELWIPPGGSEELRRFGIRFGTEQMFEDAFSLREYADAEPFAVGELEVTPARVVHYDIETYGFRISDGTRTLGYSGDSAPSPRLAEIGRDADLFLCEATLVQPEAGDLRGHLTVDEALDAFESSGAKRLVVIHRPAELPLDPALEQAHDGDVFEV